MSAGNEVERRPFSPWNPDSYTFRLLMIIGICFLTFGSYFVYDIPGAITDALTARLKMSPIEYEALYSVYSWPNTVLALVGGFLVDRLFGVRLGALIFCTLCAVGMCLFSVGVTMGNYWVAVVGRFVFGLGGESLSVTQSTYTSKWFKGKELAFAFGIALSFSRVGSAVNFNVTPWLTKHWGLDIAIWIGMGACMISVVFALYLALLDYKGTQYRLRYNGELKNVEQDKISMRDVRHFPLSLWLLVLICVTFYIAVFVFTQIGSKYFQAKWGYTETKAGSVLSIISTFSAVASPFLGFAVDKIGMSLTWVMIATTTLTGVHVWLALTTITPIVGMVFLGAAYSLCAAALWPCVALIMPSHMLGTAYGLMTAVQNLGLAVAPLAVGAVLTDTHHNYLITQFIFAGCAAAAAVLTVLLIMWDAATGRKLNSPAWRKKPVIEEVPAVEDEQKPLLGVN